MTNHNQHLKKSTLKVSALMTAVIASSSAAWHSATVAEALMLQEITVTAQKRVESLQDVPLSVSVLSGEKLNDTGIANLQDLSAYVPNFTINQTGISTTISIRGISSGINQGFEQSVGTYVDGIHYGRAQLARAPLFDLERVEVLRGPQSILFGKNSVAGAINITTARPSDEFESSITALYSPDHGEKDFRFVASGALSDTIGARLAILQRTFDGYYENTITGQDEADSEEQVLRGTLDWQATDNLRATLKLEHASFDVNGRNIEVINDTAGETGFGFSTIYGPITGGGTLDATQDFKRQANGDTSENETDNFVLTVEYLLGENTLTSITGFSAYDYDELCDCDYTGANTFTLGLQEEYDQWSQEFRIVSPVGDTFEYIGGLFYQTSDLTFKDNFLVPQGSALGGLSPSLIGYDNQRTFEQDADIWSAFIQATWNITDRARLTLGGRYTDESKSASRALVTSTTGPNPFVIPDVSALSLAENVLRAEAHAISGDRDETAFTPLANFQFDINEDMMVYATYTTGFKSGGFDVRSNASPDPSVGLSAATTTALAQLASPVGVFEFEEEEATSYELGAKMTMLDGAAELNVAVYRTDYEDLQVSIFDGGLGFNVGNAAEATVEGVELDGRWRAAEWLTLSGSAAYLDFEFEDYANGECYFLQEQLEPNTVTSPTTCSFTGERQVYTPEWTASAAADIVFQISGSLEFKATLDLNYYDDYLVSPSLDPRIEQDAFTKVGARIAIAATNGDWEIALIGKNLTDEVVTTYAAEIPASSTLVEGSDPSEPEGLAYYGFFDRPRSIALQGTYNF